MKKIILLLAFVFLGFLFGCRKQHEYTVLDEQKFNDADALRAGSFELMQTEQYQINKANAARNEALRNSNKGSIFMIER